MIDIILNMGLISSLLFIAKEDFEHRTISLVGLIIFTVFAICYGWQKVNNIHFGINIIWNLAFMTSQLIFIKLYFSIKEKRLVKIADYYLGWGDILFLIPICFLFSPFWLLLFYVSSLLLILLGFLIYKIKNLSNNLTIPLAGGQAICLICWLTYSNYCGIDFYSKPLFFFW